MIIQKPISVYKLYTQKWFEWNISNENNKTKMITIVAIELGTWIDMA